MKTIKLFLVSALSFLALASNPAASTAEDVARRFGEAILAQQEDTLADLQAQYEGARAFLLDMAATGARPAAIREAGRDAVDAMRLRTERGVRAMNALRVRGMATLERMGANPRLIAFLDEVGSVAVGRVGRRATAFARDILELVDRLV